MDLSKIFKCVYVVRIRYKSGQHHDYHCYSFTYTSDKATYESASVNNKPFKLGIDDIESMWHINCYYKWPLGIHRLWRWF